MIDVEATRRWLEASEGPTSTAHHPIGESYLRFYRLPASFHHEMGLLEVHDFQVFVQHFGLRNNRHGTVFLLHGYLDHSGLQGPTISRLLDLGFDVVALDHPGHGFSTGDRASIGDFQHYVDCLSVVYERYEKVPGPHIVMGHSLGGAISMTHMLKHPHAFKKAVLIAPLFRPRGWRLIRSMHLVGRRFIKGQRRMFRQNTRDVEFRRFIQEEDPLSPVFIPIEWIGAMLDWIRNFRSLEKVEARVLVVQGTSDGTVDWRGNLPMIRSKFAEVRVHLVHEGMHHLLNEIDEWRESTWVPIEPFLLEHIE